MPSVLDDPNTKSLVGLAVHCAELPRSLDQSTYGYSPFMLQVEELAETAGVYPREYFAHLIRRQEERPCEEVSFAFQVFVAQCHAPPMHEQVSQLMCQCEALTVSRQGSIEEDHRMPAITLDA